MGLDAYIYRDDDKYGTEVFYARKNYFLDDWMRVAGGEQRPLSTDYCGTRLELAEVDIAELLQTCREVQALYWSEAVEVGGSRFSSWYSTARRHEKLDELTLALDSLKLARHTYTYSSNC